MEIQNGQYQIQNINLVSLCKKYGTPLYVYDTDSMQRQYNRLKAAFSNIDLKINYACKALSNLNVLRLFRDMGAGLDTVSIQEVLLGLKAGFQAKDIIFTPNCVSFDEIKSAISHHVHINIDNISILEQFGHVYGDSIPVCIRFNPHIMAGGNAKISTGHIDSKFGISIHQLRHVERIVKSHNICVTGLHMHTGSDILDIDVFLRGADILLDIAHSFKNLEYIDFGSGFKVGYKPDDVTTDIELLGQRMTERFNRFCQEYGKNLTLMFEPGKYLVSESGFFLASVNVIKQTTATVFAGLDTGLNHLIRPMFYDAYHHIINISNPEANPRIYTVVGNICETDTFGWDRKINEVREGDILCFLNAGAYGFMMASNYNSRLKPAEILIHEGSDYLITRREAFDDLIRNQIPVLFSDDVVA
ncbi:MAG: diaminopimelate decarboxylase [Candidatus Competibacteraceae bacterium]|nr:diaminopimelate decarboxylase [Candidatus Competibacteraceae bacterium]